MSQVDNRNSSAAKRARTDGGRREDDWTCPSCGNVNFSFRTTCNMRNCTQSRPADHNSKFAAKPMQPMHGYSSPAPYVGSGAPSSMYMGVAPYGSSLFNGSSLPPYDVPFSGGSAYPYNYSSRFSGGSPYRSLHLSGPTPYSSGSMMGNGGIYGMPPMMDRYGLAVPMGHPGMGPRPGFFPEDKPQKKDVTRDNDWTCPKCGNVNFSFRTVCNMRKCNTPKPEPQAPKSDKGSKHKMPEGSWKCEKCNNINYPFRTKCNRQNCGADKPSDANQSPSEPADEDDQVCHEICLLPMFFWVLKFPPSLLTTYVYITISICIQVPSTSLVELCAGIVFPPPVTFLVRTCSSWLCIFQFANCFFSLSAFINLQLCNVPVSSRTCFEKVQSCRPALLSMVVSKSVMSSSCCSSLRVSLPFS